MVDEDKLRKIVANAEEQLALAHNYNWKQGCEWLLTDLQQLLAESQRPPLEDFKAHTEAVSRFLNDLYATMIDPCATGTITVGEMCRQLLTQAEKDRELLRELHELKTSLAERPQPQEAPVPNGLTTLIRCMRCDMFVTPGHECSRQFKPLGSPTP